MRILTSAALAAAILSAPAPALAQSELFQRLGRIILSAGLAPAPEASLGRSVTVVTGEELRERGTDQLGDALRRVPGISVNRTGGPGSVTHLRLRGTEPQHVVVLIDGVRLDSPQSGRFDFAGLQTADIEQIEVVRGPQSVFFGSNAIGGVVSITTRRGTEPGFSGHAGAELGSDGTEGVDFSVSQRVERGGLTFSGIVRNEGGYDISDSGGERDGMRNRTLNLSGDWQLTEDWQLGFLLRGRDQRNDFDPQNFGAGRPIGIVFDREDYDRIRERIASVHAQGDLLDGRLRLNLRASHFDINTRRFTDAQPSGEDDAQRTEFALRGSWALDGGSVDTARHRLGFGYDWQDENFQTEVLDYSRDQQGVAVEYRGELAEGLDLQLGARRDINSGFRNFTTWSAALSWALPQSGTRLRIAAGTGVQNPTLYQLFGYSGQFQGNPDLVPEQSRGWEIGVDQEVLGGRGAFSVTWFDSTLRDQISSQNIGGIWQPINLSQPSRRRGVELGVDGRITDTLTLRGAYTYTDARTQAGERLVRRPRHEATLALDWDATDRTLVTLEGRRIINNLDFDYRDIDWSLPTPVARLPDATLVNLAANHRLNDRVSLHARIVNVFDRPYEEVIGYAGQGRTFYVGLRSNF